MRAHSLLNTLTCSAASAAIATWLATFGSDVPQQSLEQRGLHIALAAYLGCLVVFMLTPRGPAPDFVPEEDFDRLAPPPPASATQGALYLDLVKRALLNLIYHERASAGLDRAAFGMPCLLATAALAFAALAFAALAFRRACLRTTVCQQPWTFRRIDTRLPAESYQIVLSRGAERRQPALAGPHFSLADRVAGEDVSLNTLSMVGLARLDSLQKCVETVLSDGVEGDLIEAGCAKGGACILMRAVLRVRKERARRVLCCDTFSDGQRRPPRQALALLFRPLFSLLALASRVPSERWQRRLYAVLMRLQHSFPVDPAHVSSDTLTSFLFFIQNGARFTRPVVPSTGTSLQAVRSHFARFGLLDEQVVFLKGFFADSLPDAPSERFALIRLDGDLYSSTMDALVHLHPKLSPDGFCIIDDYYSFEECRRAVDEYRAANDVVAPLVRIDAASVYWRK
jgi:O-methyltransferase